MAQVVLLGLRARLAETSAAPSAVASAFGALVLACGALASVLNIAALEVGVNEARPQIYPRQPHVSQVAGCPVAFRGRGVVAFCCAAHSLRRP